METENQPKSRLTKRNIVMTASLMLGLATGATITTGLLYGHNETNRSDSTNNTGIVYDRNETTPPTFESTISATPTRACEYTFYGWAPCGIDSPCSIITDPFVQLYRNTTGPDGGCEQEYKLMELESPLYLLNGTMCPSDHEVVSESECKQVAIDVFHKPGAYRTNNGIASKCYYSTTTNSVHYNPYDGAVRSNPSYISICHST